MKVKVYSTSQVVTIAGISRVTLERWIRDGKIKRPSALGNGPRNARIWTEPEVERVKKYKAKNYYKGRGGSKPKAKR